MNLAAVSAFAKAPVDQTLWAKVIVGIIVATAIVIATVFTAGAFAGVLAPIAAVIVHASAVAIIAIAVDEGLASRDKAEAEAFIETHQKQETHTHGEHHVNEWNYQEKITTDFDDETEICKKCVSSRKCEKTAWHLFSDRTCKKWASEDFENERCTEIQF